MAETGTHYEYKGARIAPHPRERTEKSDHDVVVVIPCIKEGKTVLRALASIARQAQEAIFFQEEKAKRVKVPFVASVVVVINGKPSDKNERPEVYASNLETYTLLQSIQKGYQVKTGSREFDTHIRTLQDKRLHLTAIDAFSPEHAHPDNNVGIARAIGTEHALTLAKTAIVSTDADCTLTPHTLPAVLHKLQGDADVISLGFRNDTNHLDEESFEASQRHSLYWDMKRKGLNLIRAYDDLLTGTINFFPYYDSPLSSCLIITGGAYTAFTVEAFKKTQGYEPLEYGEDTGIGHSIVEAGGRMSDLAINYVDADVRTQVRVSDRTKTSNGEGGYGVTIGKYSPKIGTFMDMKVVPLGAHVASQSFLGEIAHMEHYIGDSLKEILGEPSTKLTQEAFVSFCEERKIPKVKALEIFPHYQNMTKLNTKDHFELVQKVGKIFEEVHGTMSMAQYTRFIESFGELYTKVLIEKSEGLFTTSESQEGLYTVMSWNEYRARIDAQFLTAFGLKVLDDMPDDVIQIYNEYRAFMAAQYFSIIKATIEITKISAYLSTQLEKLESIENQSFNFNDLTPISTLSELKEGLALVTPEQQEALADMQGTGFENYLKTYLWNFLVARKHRVSEDVLRKVAKLARKAEDENKEAWMLYMLDFGLDKDKIVEKK